MNHIELPSNVIPSHYDVEIKPNSKEMTFAGSVRITVEVREPTSEIALNSLELQFDSALLGRGGNAARVTFDEKKQTAILHFNKRIEKGEYEIQIDYTGKIYENAKACSSRITTRQKAKSACFSLNSRRPPRDASFPAGTSRRATPLFLS